MAQKVEKPIRTPAPAPVPPSKSKPVTKAYGSVLFVEPVPSEILLWELGELATWVRSRAAVVRRKVRHFMCPVFNGKHELYRAYTDTKFFQQCLLCGYETRGITIDRRDRRLHLVRSARGNGGR